jgi:hypothetical protein
MIHSYDTRSKSDSFISSRNTKLFEQSTAYNGELVYNKLSSEIRSIKSTTKFKKILTFYSKRVLFIGRIYEYKFLIRRSCVQGMYLQCNFVVCILC